MKRVLESKMREEKPDQVAFSRKEGVARSWQTQRNRVVWSVAGFDPSSGAGVTADLMTFAAFGFFGCSAVTALTVQTTMGVFGWQPVDANLLEATLARLEEDLPPAGIKVGMLGTPELASVVAAYLKAKRQSAQASPLVVLDPVLRSSSGRALFPDQGLGVIWQQLLPSVDWITPNWAELAVLSEMPVVSLATAEQAARQIMRSYPRLGVIVTGGDQAQPVDLILLQDGTSTTTSGMRIETTSTHGTGCAFSSAFLAACLDGEIPSSAAQHAKEYVEGALRRAPGVGNGRGPMELLWPLRGSSHTGQ